MGEGAGAILPLFFLLNIKRETSPLTATLKAIALESCPKYRYE